MPIYRQEEARVILQAQYEARIKLKDQIIKGGYQIPEITLAEF